MGHQAGSLDKPHPSRHSFQYTSRFQNSVSSDIYKTAICSTPTYMIPIHVLLDTPMAWHGSPFVCLAATVCLSFSSCSRANTSLCNHQLPSSFLSMSHEQRGAFGAWGWLESAPPITTPLAITHPLYIDTDTNTYTNTGTHTHTPTNTKQIHILIQGSAESASPITTLLAITQLLFQLHNSISSRFQFSINTNHRCHAAQLQYHTNFEVNPKKCMIKCNCKTCLSDCSNT